MIKLEINLIKHGGVLVPATEDDQEKLSKIKQGRPVSVELKQKRNYQFHKKFFAMLNVGFDAFEPEIKEFKGHPVQKNFDRFRKEVIIAAGFFSVVGTITGEVRAVADSIAFGSMSPEDFEKLYNACCNVLLQKVLSNYTRDDLDRVVEQLIRF